MARSAALLHRSDEFRQGLKALLELERGITIVGEASDGLEVQRVSLEQKADVVLMDINMPIVDGLSATRELLRANSTVTGDDFAFTIEPVGTELGRR